MALDGSVHMVVYSTLRYLSAANLRIVFLLRVLWLGNLSACEVSLLLSVRIAPVFFLMPFGIAYACSSMSGRLYMA